MANDPAKREMEFGRLNNPNLAHPNNRKHYRDCQSRLDRIIEVEGDKISSVVPFEVQKFEQFVEFYQPLWGDPKRSYVFFRDDQRVKDKDVLAQREQLSGLCYIHAPDMLQHYLVSMNTEKSAPMIDISRLIREKFNALQLEKQIFNDEGDSAYVILRYILQPGSVVLGLGIKQIEETLREYGPILIAYFKTYDDFHSENCIHHGKHSGNEVGGHAMIIIGVRTHNNKKYFLIQNWWKQKQFIEVDEEYLKSCEANLFYVETAQFSIPKEFPTDLARFAVNSLDKPVSHVALVGPLKGYFD